MYEIEHTFSGYLYISGQLLTALANCYFFIIGVHHFHLFKIRVLVSHKSSMIYAKKNGSESADYRHEEETAKDADAAD